MDRLVVAPQPVVSEALVRVGRSRNRVQGDSGIQKIDCLLGLSQIQGDVGPVVVSLGVLRVQPNGFIQVGGCRLELT
ncbi:MAG: hypothetical protein MK125_07140 [Dehalococcoidia bacterium]|nr:hypothetical protein [Dehalococcoidia bacterium]